MTVPNIPFKGSQAHAEFSVGPPGKGTPLFAAAGLALPAKGSQLAGRSAWSIVDRPPNDTYSVRTYAYLYFKGNSTNSYWENNQFPFQRTLTKGRATIRITYLEGSDMPIFLNCTNGVAFTPDTAQRGIQLVDPVSNYNWCRLRVEVLKDGIVQATYDDVNVEASSA